MIILGLNAFHGDSAAALVCDGKLIAAAEEERFRRVKHWAGFPSQAIAYCLREAGVALSDVHHVAVNQDNRANLFRKIAYVVAQRPNIGLLVSRLKNRRARKSIPDLLAQVFPNERFVGEVHQIEHHLAHLSSAFHVSPFEEAVVVSVDGFGDFSSAAWGVGKGKSISIDGRVYFPHSLGIFYQALTQYLGFPALRRRVQGHGACALRQACLHGCHAQDRAAECRTGATSSISRIFAITARRFRISGLTGRPNSATCSRRRWRNCSGRAAGPTIRSKTAIATSPARCRRCMKRPSFI